MALFTFWSQLDCSSILLFSSTIAVFVLPIFIIFPPVPVDRSDVLGQTHSKLGRSLAREDTPPAPTKEQQLAESSGTDGTAPVEETPSPTAVYYPIAACRGIDVSRVKDRPRMGSRCDGIYTFARLTSAAHSSADQQEAAADARQGRRASGDGYDAVAADQWEALTRSDAPPWPTSRSMQLGHIEGGFVVARFPWTDDEGGCGGGSLLRVRGLARRLAAKLSRGLRAVPEREMLLPLEVPSEAEIASRAIAARASRCARVMYALP
ncbi:hypothetical protein ACCO45_011239 [Purpureocillium lilacinum]|uniref:Uncharacterized protein n=1 Tax=Purpureocillium lilacinum TaxID=33203 RepID=A0ACC4DJP0_PURLI